MTEGNVNEEGIIPNCKCCKKEKRQENTNNKIDIWCTIYRSIYFREFSNERTRVERRETFRKLRMRENFSKVDVLKFLEGTCVEIFSIRVRVFFLQYVRNFSRAPFYECEGWISWSGSTGFHLRISTTFFTGFWGLLSVDQQSWWVEYSQFCSKDPHCWIPKCKIRLVVKPIPSGLNVVCPSILSLNGLLKPQTPLLPLQSSPVHNFSMELSLSHGPCIFYHFTNLRIKCFRYKYIFVAECVQEHFWNFFSRDTLIWHIL